MSATRFTRQGYNTHKALYNLWNRHTITNPIGGPIIRNHFQQQCKAYSRPTTQSIYKKAKDINISLPGNVLSSFSWISKLGVVEWYLALIKSQPIVTKSITCALIYTAADLTSQTISEESYDLMRILRMGGFGLLISGPSLHYWYNTVSKIFPKRDIASTVKKIGMGQFLYAPAMTTVFFSVIAALQGESGEEIVARLKRDLLPTMVNGIMFWLMADFVTFKFVPVYLQPLTSNGFVYAWTIYVTYMASLEKVVTA